MCLACEQPPQLESCRINLIRLLIRLQTLEAAPVASLSNCARLLSSDWGGWAWGWWVGGGCSHILPPELCALKGGINISQIFKILPTVVTEWCRLLVMSLNNNATIRQIKTLNDIDPSVFGSWNGKCSKIVMGPIKPVWDACSQCWCYNTTIFIYVTWM